MSIEKYGRIWDVVGDHKVHPFDDWLVAEFDGVGRMYMNNLDGYIIFFEKGGTILKSDI